MVSLIQAGIGLALWADGIEYGYIVLMLAVPVLLMSAPVPLIIVHEMSHVLMARLLGGWVSVMAVGSGPIIRSHNIGICQIQVRRYPWGGFAQYHLPGFAWARTRYGLVALAGPLSDAAMCLAVLVLWPSGGGEASKNVRLALAFALAVQFLVNSIPRRSSGQIHQAVVGNDGFQVLAAMRFKEADVAFLVDQGPGERLVVMAQRGHAMRAVDGLAQEVASRPDDIEARNNLLFAQLSAEQWVDARATGRWLLEALASTADVNARLWVNVALAHAMVRGPGDLAEADRLSARAMAEVGWDGSAQGVRSLVLAALHRDEEARVLARSSMDRLELPSDRAWSHVVLCEIAARSGDYRKARLHHRLAYRLDPVTPLLDPAVRERVFGPRDRPVVPIESGVGEPHAFVLREQERPAVG